ncbi:hypothetical protein GCK72_009901 [Caenorhabditis remanei]|uniref:Uncharacterized protein n=2 Tax=Caenorhabditis TaxID=6237 RepID=E3LSQ2_CAERE|nr:hypothetical protein GCK72_009901 [Caenorhabditis remanei]EFP09159.1 hypothetical protein CRE_25356 [Caenorhabditis remanei]KAF1761645.1 hypothetical protein GCK72_009901 [Caenorhabditis remanei]
MATQSAVSTASVPQGAPSTNVSASVVPPQGLWSSAQQLFSFTAPKIGKDGEFSFQFLTSPQRAKPAATVNADNFYMYACGSINMP